MCTAPERWPKERERSGENERNVEWRVWDVCKASNQYYPFHQFEHVTRGPGERKASCKITIGQLGVLFQYSPYAV